MVGYRERRRGYSAGTSRPETVGERRGVVRSRFPAFSVVSASLSNKEINHSSTGQAFSLTGAEGSSSSSQKSCLGLAGCRLVPFPFPSVSASAMSHRTKLGFSMLQTLVADPTLDDATRAITESSPSKSTSAPSILPRIADGPGLSG